MTINQLIIQYLERNGESYKGVIEDYVRQAHVNHSMGDTTSRRLRELSFAGGDTIPRLLVGEKEGHTTYRLNPNYENFISPNLRPEVVARRRLEAVMQSLF